MQSSPETPTFKRSSLLSAAGFRHAFFTRSGGVSAGPYRSLNFSVSVGDSEENVRLNVERAAEALAVEPKRLYFLSQVHGTQVVAIDGSEDRETVLYAEGDALISLAPGVACAVRAADCVPVLIGDRESGAVAAAHAGWRGLVRGVLSATVRRLREVVGGPGDLIAAIGPHISKAAFEVSEDVAVELSRCSPAPDVVDRSGDKPHVDLEKIARAQLVALGLPSAAIERVPGCTATDSDLFSYRRDGAQSGRHLSAIVVRAPRTQDP